MTFKRQHVTLEDLETHAVYESHKRTLGNQLRWTQHLGIFYCKEVTISACLVLQNCNENEKCNETRKGEDLLIVISYVGKQ